ncbi:MAG: hypothetical protein JO308_07205, partial [Verrucomicrobia bacterium]|nr:hypothetical protein [Verrucomicrobiota bacterium]
VAKVIWDRIELGSGTGSSKKQAETAAALSALKEKLWAGLPTRTSDLDMESSDPGTNEETADAY